MTDVWHEHWWERLIPGWEEIEQAIGFNPDRPFHVVRMRMPFNKAKGGKRPKKGHGDEVTFIVEENKVPDLRWMHGIAKVRMYDTYRPIPAALSAIPEKEIEARFIAGMEPATDLESAEYLRHLERKWLGEIACGMAAAALRLAAKSGEDPRRRTENRKRAIVAMFADGDYSEPSALARRIDGSLAKDPARAAKYGFSARTIDERRRRKISIERLVKNMKEKLRQDPVGGGKIRLSVEAFEEISRDFREEGGETKRMQWSQ